MMVDDRLGRQLVLDELFDLSLYQSLRGVTFGKLQKTLDELIPIETKHCAFWQEFFRIKVDRLNPARRLKLGVIILICRIFGEPVVYLILEAIEVYGIRKYLTLWERYQATALAEGVRAILEDEFRHEDAVVSGLNEKRINPERIRNIFLGFNDGLVEFLGAVGGFFAAFQDVRSVLIASFTGAAAGAFSMAVGVYASSRSEEDMQKVALRKERFLTGVAAPAAPAPSHPFSSAIIVGISYLFGAAIPILPVLFGAQNVLISWICGGMMLILLTMVLSFISGMQMRKRVITNLAMVVLAVTAAYAIGVLVKHF